MTGFDHGRCPKCTQSCGCSFDPTSKNDHCTWHWAQHHPLDCRSPDGETVALLDAASVALRLASRRDLAHPKVQAAIADLRADSEIRVLLP